MLEEHIHPNRRISVGGAEAYSVPGGQYIKVQREYDSSAADVPQSFELTVDVRGEAEEEAGEFITTSAEYTEAFGEDSDTGREDDADESDETDREDDAESPDPSDEAEETDESEPSPSEAGGSEDGEEPSSGTDEQKDKDTEADVQAAESQDSGGIGGILPWAIGGLGVIALAGGGIILAGRRGA